MRLSSGLTDAAARLVADASTVINLIATGNVRAIVSALPNRVLIVDVVRRELELGRARGREAPGRLDELAADGLVGFVDLGSDAMPAFEDLVVGTALETLDDGEAATIAYATTHSHTALIDERKANRICADRYPALSVACTLDVLLHDAVQRELGPDSLAEAVFRALRDGRMGVMPDRLELVVGLIGEDRAALCPSIPRRVRIPARRPPT
jgi:predicted nucleic acid-binding protein